MAAILPPRSFALIASLVTGLDGAAIDLNAYSNHRSTLQNVADSAALAAAREAALNRWDTKIAQASAETQVEANMANGLSLPEFYKTETSVDVQKRGVTVKIEQDHYPYFLALLFPSPQISVAATAISAASQSVCIIGLMQPQTFAKASIHLDDQSAIEAKDCAVYSNSVDRFGLRVDSGSTLNASLTCSAGGVFRLLRATIEPAAITDCPVIQDPLAKRPMPSVEACDHDALEVKEDTLLLPGVYCDGLTVSDGAQVTLSAGIYVIKDGPFVVGGGAKLAGTNVSFVFTGDKSVFDFQSDSTIDIAAPEVGPLAGLLMYEDRSVPHSFEFNPLLPSLMPSNVWLHKISSSNARNLLGTIYLPCSILLIDADAPVADASAYTAIVVARLWLREGPTLTLNTDYAATKVPVPDGLGPTNGSPRLAR